MKCKIIGVQRKSGKFKPQDEPGTVIPYDNLMLHAITNERAITGHGCKVVKMKMADAADLIAECGGAIDTIVGHVVDIEFGKYDKVANWEVVE